MKVKSTKLERGVKHAKGTIRWGLLINIAFKNLFYKKLRTTLTIIGVVIGVGAVVFLLAFGFGLRDVVTKQVVDSNSIRTIDVESAKSQLVTLNNETIDKITQIEDVTDVSRVYSVAGNTTYGNSQIESVLYGVDQKYLDLANVKLSAGQPPQFKNADDIFVNTSYAKAIGVSDSKDLIGKELEVSLEAPVPQLADENESTDVSSESTATTKEVVIKGKVVSVFETGSGSELYVSSKIFDNFGFEDASQLKVLVDRKEQVVEAQKKIEALGLITVSPLSTLEQINQVFGFLNLLFLGFGGIGLIIAVLGMFNTLTISLLERTKEIGLMITLGARRKDILRLFVVEAVGLSMIGGALGVVVAYGLSRVADVILNGFARSRGVTETFTIFAFKPTLILAVFAFSALLGLLVVYFPAKRAANINPIEALKS